MTLLAVNSTGSADVSKGDLLVKSDKQPVVVIVKTDATGGLTPKAALPVVFTRNDKGDKA